MKKFLLFLLISSFLLPSICFGAAATMYVTVAGAGTKAGGDWDNAMGLAEWDTDFSGSVEAGDIYYVKQGTYTHTSAMTSGTGGSATAPIQVIGVVTATTETPPDSTRWAYGDDRPLLAAGGNTVYSTGSYWLWRNFRMTTTDTHAFRVYTNSIAINVYVNNSGSSGRRAFYIAADSPSLKLCEAENANGRAFELNSTRFPRAENCYAHDSTDGFLTLNTGGGLILDSISSSNTNGINLGTTHNTIRGTTIYGNTVGILGGTSGNNTITNNIISENATGASWGTEQASNVFDYNSWFNTADVVNVTTGSNSVTGNPLMNNPASGDFTLTTGSPALDSGMKMNVNMGTVGDYKKNIGVDQDDNESGGGGSSAEATLILNGVALN